MWVVAKTKGGQENRAFKNLDNQGFDVFLPRFETKKFKNNTWLSHSELMFPGYIFINLDSNLNKAYKINNTLGVYKLLIDSFSGAPSILPDNIICEIKSNINKSINISNISIGDNVIYTKGRLSNIVGTVIEMSGKSRIRLLIDLINTKREVFVDPSDIQRVYG
ncbi:MAG: transcription termination/antitermination NusG family protein [Gammaproteobacteria bacterium]|nr:transcription termination/antitermination NusG family protein [Gammaproteobacteria bacterium]